MPVPTGRLQHRIPKAEVVELLGVESPIAKVEAIIENVSPRGARVITNSICAPGKQVRLNAPNEHLNLRGRVVYCQRLEDGRFAVGLQLDGRVAKQQKPPKL